MKISPYRAVIRHDQLAVISPEPESRTLFSVCLLNQPSFFIRDSALYLRQQSGDDLLLWRSEEGNVQAVLNVIAAKMHRRRGRGTRAFSLTVMCAAVALAVSVGMNAFLSNAVFNVHYTPSATARDVPPGKQVQPVRPLPRQAVKPAPAKTAAPEVNTQQLAANLKKAADRSLFTVPLSEGHKRTLYVFSDPQCPNCVTFEPLFHTLSQFYNVQVFPVSVIGREKSVSDILPVLCAAPEARKAAWQQLFRVDAGLAPGERPASQPEPDEDGPDDCSLAQKALKVNDRAFRAYKFQGTPWVVSDDGRHVPQAVMKSPALMTQFMAQTPEDINAADN